MNIKTTYQALQTVANTVLPTFTFYGMLKSRYNSVKQVADNTIIVEPPRQWPANARNLCEAQFTAKVWLLIRQPIKQTTGGVMQYPPFAEIDIRDTLLTAALTFIDGINQHTNMRVLSNLNGDGDLITLTDAVEGNTTNMEATAYFTITIVSYGSSGSFVPAVFAPGLKCLTHYTITNGDILPTGLSPDVLFINTEVINTDISSTGTTITVPAGYMLRRCTYYIDTDDVISSIQIYSALNGVVFLNDLDHDQPIVNALMVLMPALPATSYTLTATGVTSTSTIRAKLEFQKVTL